MGLQWSYSLFQPTPNTSQAKNLEPFQKISVLNFFILHLLKPFPKAAGHDLVTKQQQKGHWWVPNSQPFIGIKTPSVSLRNTLSGCASLSLDCCFKTWISWNRWWLPEENLRKRLVLLMSFNSWCEIHVKESYFLFFFLIFQLYQLDFLVANYRNTPWLD